MPREFRWVFLCLVFHIYSRYVTLTPSSFASVAQLDRVSVSETEGHRFDPCRVHHLQYTFLQQLKSNRETISNVHAALRWYFALVDLKNNQLTDVYRF